ncbi:hypothetical protein E0W72_05495 [Flavobacterium arcticum]|uniref:hypothetical protein n=1 Tax=Flavobacterium arcticum TaxID=1784713 RepID=UPI000FDD2848|nr:hypothetical protein [Flavobacterium arcticum]KAF2511761.1 hypothetical protein E0W72_05495 [Flavobacterium arcticum]
MRFDNNNNCKNLNISDNSELPYIHGNEYHECSWEYDKTNSTLKVFDYDFKIERYNKDTIYLTKQQTNRKVLFINKYLRK